MPKVLDTNSHLVMRRFLLSGHGHDGKDFMKPVSSGAGFFLLTHVYVQER